MTFGNDVRAQTSRGKFLRNFSGLSPYKRPKQIDFCISPENFVLETTAWLYTVNLILS